jgi:hypothetical protein
MEQMARNAIDEASGYLRQHRYVNKGHTAGIILDHRCRFIGRSAVHYDVFDMRVILTENALCGRTNEMPLIVGRCYDGDDWSLHRCQRVAQNLPVSKSIM